MIFEASTIYHGMALLKARDGEIWRVWFEQGTPYPLMERLTNTDWASFAPAVKELDAKR
jgi:hypothetical protein